MISYLYSFFIDLVKETIDKKINDYNWSINLRLQQLEDKVHQLEKINENRKIGLGKILDDWEIEKNVN